MKNIRFFIVLASFIAILIFTSKVHSHVMCKVNKPWGGWAEVCPHYHPPADTGSTVGCDHCGSTPKSPPQIGQPIRNMNNYGMGVDLGWYCKYKHGQSAGSSLIENNAYGWKCIVNGQPVGIDMNDACRSHYGNGSTTRMGNFNDANSWYCVGQ